MFSILQRYTFESNSQPFSNCSFCQLGCFLSCKDTHLKAIHNDALVHLCQHPVVFYLAKIHIWKQFTTSLLVSFASFLLFSILQRYTFESNSQPVALWLVAALRCFLSCKDTHLKAIHNTHLGIYLFFSVVFYLAKIHIWKQFTTKIRSERTRQLLFSILQRYTFESNSQPPYKMYSSISCCFLSCKDTHLKAIHNRGRTFTYHRRLFSILQRYTFESNSQRNLIVNGDLKVVFYLAKIHIWKQFTTVINILMSI